MRRCPHYWLPVWLLFACGACCMANLSAAAEPAPINFSRQILPILSDNCFYCHGPDEKHREAKLRLDDEPTAKLLTDGKAAIIPGQSAASELVKRILSADPDEVMPPPTSQRKLTEAQKELLKRWIDEGATWGGHWAFQPLTSTPILAVDAFPDQANGMIDAWIFRKLASEKLAPSPVATKEALLRRVTLDLTGLPPSLASLDQFLADASPDAYERQVDRLLASPAFGQRMSWEWLDAARYADSNGYQGDGERTMWPWRDWVTETLNRDLPYDQFSIWQLAGDQLPNATPEQKLATGFCRNHMINGEGGRIAEENRVDYVMDMAETTGTVWLGLTFNCCRCHDHKFDPLSNVDYYSLNAFFNQTPVNGGGGDPQSPPNLEVPSPQQVQQREKLQVRATEASQAVETAESVPDNVKTILKIPAANRSAGQLAELEKYYETNQPAIVVKLKALHQIIDERDALQRSIPRVMIMEDQATLRKTFLLDKGLYDKPKDEVTAAVPHSLPALPAGTTANRLALAKWLFSPEQPLTARVTVNRWWQQVFGIGLVKTVEDFGVQAETPLHPELLDYLAADFRDQGWQVKRLVRKLVTSRVYRQQSHVSAELLERDPANRLLARAPRFRLPSWMIRDVALATSGLLDERQGGSPVKPYQPSGIWEEATFGGKQYQPDTGASLYRRSIYTFWRRIVGPTMFFDVPARQICTVKQTRTNTPLHALATLNDVQHVEAARVLAEKLLQTAPTDEVRLQLAYRTILGRLPTADEQGVLTATLQSLTKSLTADPAAAKELLTTGAAVRDARLPEIEHAAWTALCNALLNTDEAITKE